MAEKQQIGLTRLEWELVLEALATTQKNQADDFAILHRKIVGLLGQGAPK